jgi:hypothetical protein
MKRKSASVHIYGSVTLPSLARLPIKRLGSYVLLWTTVAFTEQGFWLIRQWGFEPVTMLAWIKATTGGVRPVPFSSQVIDQLKSVQTIQGIPKLQLTPCYGIGYWFRGAFEPIIVGRFLTRVPSRRNGSD